MSLLLQIVHSPTFDVLLLISINGKGLIFISLVFESRAFSGFALWVLAKEAFIARPQALTVALINDLEFKQSILIDRRLLRATAQN